MSDLCTQMSDIAAKHLAYPVLRHFHAAKMGHYPARAALLLSDAVFLMGRREADLAAPPGLLKLLRASIDDSAALDQAASKASSADREQQRRLLRSEADRLGIAGDQRYEAAQTDYLAKRERLAALCDDDGWPV